MQYRYEFEIAALIIMVIILMHYYFVRQYPTKKAKVFHAALVASILECAFNIASSLGLANADFVPLAVNEVLAFAFFAAEGLVSYLLFYYIILVCDCEPKTRRWFFVAANLPFAFFELMVLATPFIGFFYYFENNQYHQGFGANYGYAYIGYFYVVNLVIIAIQHKKVSTRLKVTLLSYTFCAICSLMIQFTHREIILTSTANVIVLFLVYLSMQNPGEYMDVSTGVGNANALKLQMQEMMRAYKKFSIVSIELKDFQGILSLFGVESGDELLSEIGKYLSGVGGKFHVFHRRDEAFKILIPEGANEAEILAAVKTRFEDSWQIQNNYIYVETVLVVQRYPQDFKEMAEFFEKQEYLFDTAKEQGSHCIENNEELIGKFNRRKQVEQALKRAVDFRKVDVYFQPIYSLKEKKIVSLEALARINDDIIGFVPPDEFIPLAEKDGSIIHIGEIVLEECCRFLSKRILSNDSLDITSIQVNVSVAQCMQKNLKENILATLKKYHVPTPMITLEITESTEIQAPELMLRQMTELNAAGIQFAADDYGTGNSNFSYLVKFPFREIKIDREMTWAYFENDTARIILDNEIKTMQQLGIPVVVEGIETQEQSDAMAALGVPYIQGYYYGKPMPEKECLLYLRQFAEKSNDYGR